MKTPNKNNNLTAYLLFLVGFFVLVFFARNFYEENQVLRDEKDTLMISIEESEKELGELNTLKNELSASGSEAKQAISPFRSEVNDTKIMEYLFDYAGEINAQSDRVVFRNINIERGEITDIGLSKATVRVSAIFAGESTLFNFLNTMTQENAEYKFYIPQFTYPMNEKTGNIQVDIPLTLYYK